ncbi:LLM class flavin-dependent oxidoreductase [Pseudonocardia nigra]|uniref:LLM class flavin-dependent oxidoreductase n=1 Tax=Pseudonocardia nigra TaxID=1921578 RepID=UPI001C5ED128|nr:LLM class flavin-dependent oxidoreductase [Pseudonocardia nigra]
MKLGVTMPVDDGLTAPDYLRLARAAEEHGYDSVWVGEVAGPEVFAMLGLIAAGTSRIRVGSGIAGIYPRSAALTAMGFATLASAAPGRVLAGLGASSPTIVRDWHGREFDAPLATAEGYVSALRQAWAGERVSVDRPRVRGFRAGLLPPTPPPVVLAAMNPGMLRLAGRIADGVFITWCPPDEVAAKLALVREGEREAGRPPGTVWAMASFWGYAGERVDEATQRLRRLVLQYAMVPTHRASFAGAFAELDRATRRWHDGDRRGALALVPDEAVHRLCAVGDGATVARRARDLNAAGVDLSVVLTPGAEPGDLDGPLATIEGLAQAARTPAR